MAEKGPSNGNQGKPLTPGQQDLLEALREAATPEKELPMKLREGVSLNPTQESLLRELRMASKTRLATMGCRAPRMVKCQGRFVPALG